MRGLLISTALALVATPALAQETYFTGRLGRLVEANVDTSFGDIALTDGGVYEVGLGYDTSGPLRFEVTATRINTEVNAIALSVPARSTSIMGHAYFDLPNMGAATPFVGAGYGWMGADIPTAIADLDAEGQVAEVAGGFAIPLSAAIMGEVAVKHRQSFELESAYGDVGDVASTAVTVGARVAF